MAVVYSEAAPRVLRVFRKPAGVGVGAGSGGAGREEGPAWRTPGGGRVSSPSCRCANLGRAPRTLRRDVVLVAPGHVGSGAPVRLGYVLRCRPARTVSRARWERCPGAASFCCPARLRAGGTLARRLRLGPRGAGKGFRGPVLAPPSVRLRRRCRFSAVGCPSRRSRAAPRPPPGVSGDQVLPAQRQRASPVPGVFAVLGRGCAPSSTQSWARVSRLCGGEWGRQIGQWCWLLGLSASVSLFIIAFGEISQVWLRKGVFFQLRSRSFSFLSGILN